MNKIKNPPRTATLTEQLHWFLKNCGTTPFEVARQTGIHHTTLYRFLNGKRTLSFDALNKLAKALNLRLIQDKK